MIYEKQHAQIINRRGSRNVAFEEGDTVLTNNYGKGDKKIEGTIVKQLSPSTYEVQVESNKTWKRHKDQIISVAHKTEHLRR